MNHQIFLTSDTHFGQKSICDFLAPDGVSKLRPFSSAEEMDEALVKNWNETVRPCDKVYHLGDVTMSHKALPILARLNGTKILIRGNHDTAKLSQYAPYFKDVRGCHVLDSLLLTHIPVHPDSKGRFRGNVHGHLHARRIMMDGEILFDNPNKDRIGQPFMISSRCRVIDPFYLCVSVEQTNFRPINFEEVKKYYAENSLRGE